MIYFLNCPFPQTEGVLVARESKFSSLRPQTLYLKRHCSWTSWNCASVVRWIHGIWQQQNLGVLSYFEIVKRISWDFFRKLFISNYPSSWCSCLVLKVINCCYVDAWSQIATTAADTCQKQLKFWTATFDVVTVCTSFKHFESLPSPISPQLWMGLALPSTAVALFSLEDMTICFWDSHLQLRNRLAAKVGKINNTLPYVFQFFHIPKPETCRSIPLSPCWGL